MKIIAFFGAQGAGKTTAANILASAGFVKISFADPIYNMVSALLGWDARSVCKNTPQEKLGGLTVRKAMQSLGTEWGRRYLGETIWIDHARTQIATAQASGARGVVIDDLRFDNEYQLMMSLQACIVEVSRNTDNKNQSNDHASEVDRENFAPRFTLPNNEGVGELTQHLKLAFAL